MTRGRFISLLALALVATMFAAGCRSPRRLREAAERDAYRILEEVGGERLGKTQDYSIQSPAHQLRRRLLLEQALPAAFSGSAGAPSIEPISRLGDRAPLAESGFPQERGARMPPWVERVDDGPLVLSLEEALQVGARNSREYQERKEGVFVAALDLDLERDAFRNTWQGLLSGDVDADLGSGDTVSWTEKLASLEVSRLFKTGTRVTAKLGINLVRLLAGGSGASMGVFGDASISLPLLRDAGRFVVTEPMKQAERNVTYAMYEFERFKRSFAVRVAAEYLGVLQERDRVRNAEENYRGLVASARRARRLADMGRLPEIQVDQAMQDELRARDRWIGARQRLERSQDAFRLLLGLPVDAAVVPDPAELEKLARMTARLGLDAETTPQHKQMKSADSPIKLEVPDRKGGGPYEMDPERAIPLAFDKRLDLRVAIARIDDAQRDLVVGANDLQADLTLLGSLSVGERRSRGAADQPDADLRFDRGRYSSLLSMELPLERRAERNRYRKLWVELEQTVRRAQALEDEIKFEVRDRLRVLLEAREAARIQMLALKVARRRVRGTDLFLEQGRAEIRDVLEARESLISAENALTSAVVRYRIAELEFQRDLGVLEINEKGLWTEYEL